MRKDKCMIDMVMNMQLIQNSFKEDSLMEEIHLHQCLIYLQEVKELKDNQDHVKLDQLDNKYK